MSVHWRDPFDLADATGDYPALGPDRSLVHLDVRDFEDDGEAPSWLEIGFWWALAAAVALFLAWCGSF